MRRAVSFSLMALLATGLATTVIAQSLPRLPKTFGFPKSPDSPGIVAFNHETHIAIQEKPDCTVCHSKLFKILEPGAPAEGGRIRHEFMEKKRQCSACHNGEAATGLDQCDYCHKTEARG